LLFQKGPQYLSATYSLFKKCTIGCSMYSSTLINKVIDLIAPPQSSC